MNAISNSELRSALAGGDEVHTWNPAAYR